MSNSFSYAGCFAGNSLVSTGRDTNNGLLIKEIPISELRKGDYVQTAINKYMYARITCITKRYVEEMKMCKLGTLLITPWHPIYENGTWQFPANFQREIVPYTGYIYNLVLESQHNVLINGTVVVTLGHDFIGPNISHNYFGSQKVIDDLKKINGWNTGELDLSSYVYLRDFETNAVVKLVTIESLNLRVSTF
jgi:hypothetical protein